LTIIAGIVERCRDVCIQ